MASRRRLFLSLALCFVAGVLVLLSPSAQSQTTPDPVWTWHNDNNRTGQYLTETALTPTAVETNFGLLWQYHVAGQAYAQPLALYQTSGVKNCNGPCDMVFVATEQDMLYAFNADSNNQIWSTNLAALIPSNNSYSYVYCNNLIPPCGTGVISPYIGVTGTPVIDPSTNILYVVTAVCENPNPTQPCQSQNPVFYYLHAIDVTTGNEEFGSPYQITAQISGVAPSQACASASGTGTLTFDPNHHIQRAGLLLLNNTIYAAFSPVFGETQNGWILSYTYNTGSGFAQAAVFTTTPFGTGGGIWMSGAGLAAGTNSDNNTYIFVATANGTFDANSQTAPNTDFGDSLLRLKITPQGLQVDDWFAPADVFTYQGPQGTGRCINDEDLGSGGVMVFPDSFFDGHPDLMVVADKESTLYVVDRDNLTHFHPPTNTEIVEELTTPTPVEQGQGYWSAPAYWEWTNGQTTTRAIYYSVDATTETPTNAPKPLNMYVLNNSGSSGPIPSTYTSTPTLFCSHGATPSISANGTTGGGIVWAIEATNKNNVPPTPNCDGRPPGTAALHAYDATNVSAELYNSSTLQTNPGYPVKFSTPTIFNDKVFMGTLGKVPMDGTTGVVDVFGLCSGGVNGKCMP